MCLRTSLICIYLRMHGFRDIYFNNNCISLSKFRHESLNIVFRSLVKFFKLLAIFLKFLVNRGVNE